MNSQTKYWEIRCTKHLLTIYQTKVSIKHLTEKKLIEFMKVLMSKYVLSDDEILEQYKRIPFKTTKDLIGIIRTNSKLNEPLSISFSAQLADISISAWLTD